MKGLFLMFGSSKRCGNLVRGFGLGTYVWWVVCGHDVRVGARV